MREILFRGKDQYNDWIYGYLCQHRGDPIMDNGGAELVGSDYYIRDWAEKIDTGFYGCNYKVFPSTVGQYTGLTDKNGRKIFEGDIIKTCGQHSCFDKVEFLDELAGFYAVNDDIHIPAELASLKKNFIEVIGNTHDNPELLEADK